MNDAPYTRLATGYDLVMAHVEYPAWAEYIQALIDEFEPGAESVTELGCGTGTFATYLQPLGPAPNGYTYHAFDGSDEMIRVARTATGALPITTDVARFQDPVPAPPADVVILLYDGLNYLLDPNDVKALLQNVHDAIVPGGLAIIDQSTPANSLHHVDGFDDAGETPSFSYVRTSRYDRDTKLHTTVFELTFPDGSQTSESHVQRAYSLNAIRDLVDESDLLELAALDDDGTGPADGLTHRIHWVLRRPH